jgi:hypothetical protein
MLQVFDTWLQSLSLSSCHHLIPYFAGNVIPGLAEYFKNDEVIQQIIIITFTAFKRYQYIRGLLNNFLIEIKGLLTR